MLRSLQKFAPALVMGLDGDWYGEVLSVDLEYHNSSIQIPTYGTVLYGWACVCFIWSLTL